jgi:hypothetical protein
MDGKTQGDQSLFKLADKLLIEFAKAPSSWEIVFAVLQMQDGISDAQYFQAANIFKNKLKIDLVTIKGSAEAVNSIR